MPNSDTCTAPRLPLPHLIVPVGCFRNGGPECGFYVSGRLPACSRRPPPFPPSTSAASAPPETCLPARISHPSPEFGPRFLPALPAPPACRLSFRCTPLPPPLYTCSLGARLPLQHLPHPPTCGPCNPTPFWLHATSPLPAPLPNFPIYVRATMLLSSGCPLAPPLTCHLPHCHPPVTQTPSFPHSSLLVVPAPFCPAEAFIEGNTPTYIRRMHPPLPNPHELNTSPHPPLPPSPRLLCVLFISSFPL